MPTRALALISALACAMPASAAETVRTPDALDYTIALRPDALQHAAPAVTLTRPSAETRAPHAAIPSTGAPDSLSRTVLTAREGDDPLTVPLGERADDADAVLRLNAERTTVLADGGIGETSAFPDEQTRRERLQSYAQGDAEFDHYDLKLEWDALSQGPVTFVLSGGVRAISASAARRVEGAVAPGIVATSYDQSRGVVPVPVVGGGIRVDLADGVFFSGGAATHTIPEGATLLDFTAQTGIELNPNVGIYAGYQMIRSSVELDSINAELDQEGVFARLRIRF